MPSPVTKERGKSALLIVAVTLWLTFASSAFVTNAGLAQRAIVDEPCPIGGVTTRFRPRTPLLVRIAPKLTLEDFSITACVNALRPPAPVPGPVPDLLSGGSDGPGVVEELAILLETFQPEFLKSLEIISQWKVVANHDLKTVDNAVRRAAEILFVWLQAFERAKKAPEYPNECKLLLDALTAIKPSLKGVSGNPPSSAEVSPAGSVSLASSSSAVSSDLASFAEASFSSARTLSQGGVWLAFGVGHMELDELAGESLPEAERLSTTIGVLSAGFGVLDRFDLNVAIPLLSLDSDALADGPERGIGNVTLDGRFQVMGKRRRLGLALDAGVILPTADQERLLGAGLWTGRIGATFDRIVGRPGNRKALLTPFAGAWVSTRDRETGYGLRVGTDATWRRVTLLTALTGAFDQVPDESNDDYVDLLVGVRVRFTGNPASEVLSFEESPKRKARVDGSLTYIRYLTDEGAIPSDGFLSFAINSNW